MLFFSLCSETVRFNSPTRCFSLQLHHQRIPSFPILTYLLHPSFPFSHVAKLRFTQQLDFPFSSQSLRKDPTREANPLPPFIKQN